MTLSRRTAMPAARAGAAVSLALAAPGFAARIESQHKAGLPPSDDFSTGQLGLPWAFHAPGGLAT